MYYKPMESDSGLGTGDVSAGRGLADMGRRLRNQAIILGGFILLIWLLELIDLIIFDHSLDAYGIQPRTLAGLRGILFMPFLHADFGHVLANTVPFIILGWLVMMRSTTDFFIVTGVVLLVSGLGVWFLGGSGTVHIGASALIFGFLGFLLLRAYFEWSLTSIFVALVVGMLYSGLIWGVLPLTYGVSWQGHLFGFIGGALAAYLLTSKRQGSIFNRRPG
ncbi:MAG: rhomboid family intramembrane serine protease [Candidatus Promineifilaceae bacterium]